MKKAKKSRVDELEKDLAKLSTKKLQEAIVSIGAGGDTWSLISEMMGVDKRLSRAPIVIALVVAQLEELGIVKATVKKSKTKNYGKSKRKSTSTSKSKRLSK